MPEGFSTDSYPKPAQAAAAPSLLDNVAKFGAIQQQKINLDQSQLKLMNEHYHIVNNELATMTNDPQATKEEVVSRMHKLMDGFNAPPEARKMMEDEFSDVPAGVPLAQNPLLKRKLDFVLRRGMDTAQKIQQQYGTPGLINRGQDVVPVLNKPGSAPQQSGAPIPLGVSPETAPTPTPIYDPVAGNVSQGTRGQYISNAGVPPLSDNIYERPSAPATSTPQTQPARPKTAPLAPPLNAEASRKQYAQESAEAPSLLDSTKPLVQVLPFLDGLTTGIGTPQYNKAVAALTNIGWIKADEKNPAVITQIVKKKLNSFVQQFGSNSDKQLAQTEASSPNTGQLQPALLHLTMDAIAQNRMKAARNMAFKDDADYKGNQDKYQEYASKMSNMQHPDAYKMDLLPREKQKEIIEAQLKKAQGGNVEAQRFIRSYAQAKKLQMLNVGQ